jgi:GntR family transcriptional repressor for pyruvate dehydrogenase complex
VAGTLAKPEMRSPDRPPQKLAEHIAEQLRGQIVRRELADGDFLPVEAELCDFFETSRPTMREAFRILEAEGLLRIRRGGRYGPQVCAPDPAVTARQLGLLLQHRDVDIGAVYDAFLDIVPLAARRLAERHTDADIARLREQRARCEEAVDDGAALLDASTEFSLLIVELAGNPVWAVLSRLLAEVLRTHRLAMSAYFEAKPGVRARRAADVIESTATVIRLIEAGDPRVEAFLLESLGTIQRMALKVPVHNPVQLV